ncbi:hypothetical protein CU102_16070 [Phyllobacterium brassicacearum]|uniref:Uncharacterized protein n=1 Tax=Phyllobacterium brassicacearum TaxID=314235 RepID=A0A2P7BNM9_9HYPH|nr:hypothetical protein CU102_16070 [Phyllobacterium brassicacearum]
MFAFHREGDQCDDSSGGDPANASIKAELSVSNAGTPTSYANRTGSHDSCTIIADSGTRIGEFGTGIEILGCNLVACN